MTSGIAEPWSLRNLRTSWSDFVRGMACFSIFGLGGFWHLLGLALEEGNRPIAKVPPYLRVGL